MPNWALPRSAADALNSVPGRRKSGNPGLVLDRLLEYPTAGFGEYKPEHQKDHLDIVCEAMRCNAADLNPVITEGWPTLLSACDGAEEFSLRTVWRLAMHLSRATAVENASLCLHPVYGFPYLPGTGLKGLARAWAERAGLKDSDEFRRIFGKQEGTGSVLFLEAWPVSISSDANRPTIEVDIVNNHHPEYYRNRGINAPPGDWESPNPVYFLAVAPDVTFRFALAKARPATTPGDLAKAMEWLKNGLTQLGFGAKTAAGYGYFAETSGQAGASGSAGASTDPLEQFKQKHGQLQKDHPDKSAAGQAITDAEALTDVAARQAVAAWVYERIESWGMLGETTKKHTTPYGERLQSLLEGTD